MIKGFTVQKQHHHQHRNQQVFDQDNMSNLTSASGDQAASVSSSGNQNPLQNYTFPPLTNQPQQSSSSSLKRKRNLPGNPDPEAEVISLSPKTLMERNRFICEICSKGFARDQNLQLHRRGHNLPWKLKQRNTKDVIRKKVYVCPETTCVHHDPSRALGDLTGIKKHFSRKHGEKKWKCDKCSKMYAVQSDWKAHSKTCGTREYRCDCGTLFSRRDSFITHRAFCDALAEESSRAITEASHHHHQLPLPPNSTTTSSSPLSHMSSNNMNHDLTFQTHNFNNNSSGSTNDAQQQQQHLSHHPMFTMKKEQQNLPPWLSQMEHQHHHHSMFTTNSNSNSNQQEQDFRNVGPPPPAAATAAAAYMSATALLQKAAQMGSTMSKNNNCSSSSSAPLNNNTSNNTAGFGLNLSSCEKIIATAADTSTTVDRVTFGLTDHSVPPPLPATSASVAEAFFHDMMMNSLSSHSPGFDPSNAFEDAFSFGQGNNTASRNNHNHLDHDHDQSGTGGGGNNDDGLTRDFFGFSK